MLQSLFKNCKRPHFSAGLSGTHRPASLAFFPTFSFAIFILLLIALLLSGSTSAAQRQDPSVSSASAASSAASVDIPAQGDWTDRGVVLAKGPAGSWDVRLAGISPTSVVKKNGVYYLYYVGADGNRSSDGGPRHRALGVATSTDGINFTKYNGNPIITHLPHNNQEEGIFSAAATLDANGDIVLYYGAIWANNSTTTSVDVFIGLAVSSDGINFTDLGYVRRNSGAEETPVGVYELNGTWNLYYIQTSGWNLRLLSGPAKDTLTTDKSVLSAGSNIIGGGAPVQLGGGEIALFLVRDFSKWVTEVRTASATVPGQLSSPVETYDFPDFRHATVFLDQDSNTWYMYYLNGVGDGIGVKTAPVNGGSSDTTPPSTVTSLSATPVSQTQVDLSWAGASDPESGISGYNIYRDSAMVGTSSGLSFSDTGLQEGTTYTYEVSAVNGAGLGGPQSAPAIVATLADITPPSIQSVTAQANATQVTVGFSEPVGLASATDPANYSIDNGITIASVALVSDLKTVTLTTSSHSVGVNYTLTVNNVLDRAKTPNTIATDTQGSYTFVSQLVVSNLSAVSGKAYQVMNDGLISGASVYIDRSFTFTSVPVAIQDATYIQTANGDKNRTETSFLSFSVNQDVTVYVAYDSRASSLPHWLSSWSNTGQTLVNTDVPLNLYSQSFPSGSITLGGNFAVGASGAGSNYSVAILGNGGSIWDGDAAFTMALEGRSDTGLSWSIPFDVDFYTPASAGSSTLVFSSALTTAPSTGKNGTFVINVAPGTYDIWAKGENTLALVLTDVNLNTEPSSPVGLGLQVGGDSTKDDVVNNQDVLALLSVMGRSTVFLTAGEKLNDHNRDGVVDIVDYAIIIQNFDRFGDTLP